MKIFSLILIFIFSASVGFYLKFRIQKREKSLEQCILLLENINTKISFTNADMSRIITDFSRDSDLVFLRRFEGLEDISNIKERWSRALKEGGFSDCLKKDDGDILLSFGNILGITDAAGQKNNCVIHIKLLENSLNEARDENIKKGKLVSSLCLLTGLSIILLFI